MTDLSWTTTHGHKVEMWRSRKRWLWHRRARNGEILCWGEGYIRRIDCLRMAERINPKVEP